MHDAIIIGKGPAGMQAAIYLARSQCDVVLVGHGDGSLAKASKVSNYFGFEEPVSGPALLKAGMAQAQSLGVRTVDAQAVGLAFAEGGFAVRLPGESLDARALLIATGASRDRPRVKGLDEYEGKGVSFCAVCDGFFYRGRKVGVLGFSDYALHESLELSSAGAQVTIFTNGEELGVGEANKGSLGGFDVSAGRVAELLGEGGRFNGLRFENGDVCRLDGLFVAYGIAGSADFAKKLGLQTHEDGSIAVDVRQSTNIPGVYAAGDCTGAFRQIAVAVGQGAIAARSIAARCNKARRAETRFDAMQQYNQSNNQGGL